MFKYKGKIESFIYGAMIAVISMLIYKTIQKLDTTWITVLGIWVNIIINFLVIAIVYNEQYSDIITEGDLYIYEHGSVNFYLPILLSALSIQYNDYFLRPDAMTIDNYVLASTTLIWFFIYYSTPIRQYNTQTYE